jgi:hypothetical protein
MSSANGSGEAPQKSAVFDRRPKDGCERGECGQVKRKIGTAKPLQSYAIA